MFEQRAEGHYMMVEHPRVEPVTSSITWGMPYNHYVTASHHKQGSVATNLSYGGRFNY